MYLSMRREGGGERERGGGGGGWWVGKHQNMNRIIIEET